MPDTRCYIGRFAPSPSGPLHFGSMIAAVASYLQAKSQNGKWLLRIEDIDTPRMVPGADSDIMHTLEQFGLYWDDTVVYQSQRLERYQQIFTQLQQQHLIYGCICSRKQIANDGGLYRGRCANARLTEGKLCWRLRSNNVNATFNDAVFGVQSIPADVADEDYIVKRRDGLFSYQLVVVVDDLDQRISQVIRGADLLSMTPRQQALFALLGKAPPEYGHLPLAVIKPGFKLSKQNHASDIRQWPVSTVFAQVLKFLGHSLPQSLIVAPVAEQLAWAVKHWHLGNVPCSNEIAMPHFC